MEGGNAIAAVRGLNWTKWPAHVILGAARPIWAALLVRERSGGSGEPAVYSSGFPKGRRKKESSGLVRTRKHAPPMVAPSDHQSPGTSRAGGARHRASAEASKILGAATDLAGNEVGRRRARALVCESCPRWSEGERVSHQSKLGELLCGLGARHVCRAASTACMRLFALVAVTRKEIRQ